MLYLDDTFNKEEVLMNFDELEVQNSLFNNYAFLSWIKSSFQGCQPPKSSDVEN